MIKNLSAFLTTATFFCASWLTLLLDNSNYTTQNCYWILFQKGKMNSFLVPAKEGLCYFLSDCYQQMWRNYHVLLTGLIVLSISAAQLTSSQIYKPGAFDIRGNCLRKECTMWLQKRHLNSSGSLLNKQNVDVCGELNICVSL